MKIIALSMLFLNPVLWASFYAISKGALHNVDPVFFATIELSVAAVPASILLIFLARTINDAVIKAGLLLGAVLFAAVIGSTIALYFTTATNTAFFPALNGAIAALITVVVFRRPVSRPAWIATGLATFGALLLIANSAASGGDPKGDIIALLSAGAYTVYIFAVDHQLGERTTFNVSQLLAVSCIETLFMACLGWGGFLVQGGNAGSFHDSKDVMVAAIYVGLFTTFAPTFIACMFQRYVPPMSVALLYVLEPIWGAVAAYLLEGEILSIGGYVGGALIVLASLLNVFSARPSSEHEETATLKMPATG